MSSTLWQAVKNKIEGFEHTIATDVSKISWTDVTGLFKDIVAVLETLPGAVGTTTTAVVKGAETVEEAVKGIETAVNAPKT